MLVISCRHVRVFLGSPRLPNGVEFEGRLAHVGTFPIGIEPNSFIEVSCAVATINICANFRFVSL